MEELKSTQLAHGLEELLNTHESLLLDEPNPPAKKSGRTSFLKLRNLQTHSIDRTNDDLATILGPIDQLIQQKPRKSIEIGAMALEALNTNTRTSKKVSIDLTNVIKEFNVDDVGTSDAGMAVDAGIPRMSIADIAEDDWKEQDAGLRLAVTMAHTLLEKECAAVDVIRVWEEISKFILLKMMEGRAVIIAGLGTFTYKIHKTPVNQKVIKVIKYPVFLLSQHLVSTYGLIQEKCHHSNAPQVPLNLSVIAYETHLPRGMIEGILTEILQAFARGVVCQKPLELPFPGIGKLYIRQPKVLFKFYSAFCNQLGFNTAETKSQSQERILEHNVIPGRMTPLKLHIPTDTYRSVFHLREVRSVHEDSVMVPLTKVDGKYVPVTLNPSEGVQNNVDEKSGIDVNLYAAVSEELKAPTALKSRVSDGRLGKNLFQVEMERAQLKKTQMERSIEEQRNPKPLYQPQETGDCILDAMNKCPEVMTQCLRAHLYRVFIETLGKEQVKAHFHRRGFTGISQMPVITQVIFNKISPSNSTDSEKPDTASDLAPTDSINDLKSND